MSKQFRKSEHRAGDVRVNATDYDEGIVVERLGYFNQPDLWWAVPAWEEQGLPELAGPFSSTEEAEQVLADTRSAFYF